MKPEPIPARACQDVASREVVEALHDVAEVLSVLIDEFLEPIDKATLLDALEKILNVALTHDQLGGYQVYPAIDAEEAPEEARA